MLGPTSRDESQGWALVSTFLVRGHRHDRVVHIVAVHCGDDTVANVVNEHEAPKSSHSERVRVLTHTHSRDSATLAPDQVVLKLHMILRPQVMHEKGTFLC